MSLHSTEALESRAFVMLNASICEPTTEMLRQVGSYDPESQTWVGPIESNAGTFSQRSTGANGDYASVSDD